jgi:hypothetical protein
MHTTLHTTWGSRRGRLGTPLSRFPREKNRSVPLRNACRHVDTVGVGGSKPVTSGGRCALWDRSYLEVLAPLPPSGCRALQSLRRRGRRPPLAVSGWGNVPRNDYFATTGWTTARHSAHRDHRRETRIQNARSMGRSRGRGVARRRIASCWRSTRFSATRLALGRKAAKNAPTIASTSASIVATFAPAEGPCQRRIGEADGVRSSTPMLVRRPRGSRETRISPRQPEGPRIAQ